MTATVIQLRPKRIRRMMTQAEFDAFRERESLMPTPIHVTEANRGCVALAAQALGMSEFDLMNQLIAKHLEPIADAFIDNWQGGDDVETG